ncbi:DUF3267 domain-containing protein [Sporosarcina gallistercoris]|uniref:DUF3267 domain-containing protein n=1 Tax=Sporosarcina gallistercoris TaxID=2762245 RepID=A0ABR8PN05_9BACL|nr:DUF3267 domain-containing protein [Sporosarcina gallistercoris]MBD7909574.1 DUF3267 domain-containing protein [Sporosarcina gallistercoris]
MLASREPAHIVDLDLQIVAKKGLWVTLWVTLGIFVFDSLIQLGIQQELTISFSFWKVLFVILGYIVLIVVHELFHLLGFRVFAGVPWRKMIIGVNLKLGIAYATTDEWMTNAAIRKALLLPFWTTGVIPTIIGLYLSDGVWLLLGGLLIGGAVGDFAMYKELKQFPDDWLVKDDPERPRLYLHEPADCHGSSNT